MTTRLNFKNIEKDARSISIKWDGRQKTVDFENDSLRTASNLRLSRLFCKYLVLNKKAKITHQMFFRKSIIGNEKTDKIAKVTLCFFVGSVSNSVFAN